MRLFAALFRRKHMPPGHIWRGKIRLSKEVTLKHLQDLKDKFEIEEQNMFYLRNAYLTPEQSFGHARALGKNQERYVATMTKRKEYYDNVTIESRLAHLRVNEPWDV
ncbi:ribosomal protein 63, mitochondrial-like [Anthonomus grandis grandis]|uniref:ribosomal protein 63, mitochondrial-like n=1 Tax=Anthonomus grandis grandis TaxID=2921223 RepID=UPI0021664A8F|nr:ribosomal protein 63, mitochondrial-like [Anthonomus grandis grandis]XP_050312524.1 ribosomal protein 63, mitochondrial-like [Anthonomus grandis grandis]